MATWVRMANPYTNGKLCAVHPNLTNVWGILGPGTYIADSVQGGADCWPPLISRVSAA